MVAARREANAAANILLHLAGSNRYYFEEVIRGRPIARDRDAEFTVRGGVSKDAMRAAWNASAAIAADVLNSLQPSQLMETTDRTGKTTTLAQVLLHVSHHNATHHGTDAVDRPRCCSRASGRHRPQNEDTDEDCTDDRGGAASSPRSAAAQDRTEQYKTEVVASVDGMAKLAQEMVDTVFSFGELGLQEVETSRYLTGDAREERLHGAPRRGGHADGLGGDVGIGQAGDRARLRHRRHPAGVAEAGRRRTTRRSSRARPATAKATTPACR